METLLPWRVKVKNTTIAAFETARGAGDYLQSCGAPEDYTFADMTIVFSGEAI